MKYKEGDKVSWSGANGTLHGEVIGFFRETEGYIVKVYGSRKVVILNPESVRDETH